MQHLVFAAIIVSVILITVPAGGFGSPLARPYQPLENAEARDQFFENLDADKLKQLIDMGKQVVTTIRDLNHGRRQTVEFEARNQFLENLDMDKLQQLLDMGTKVFTTIRDLNDGGKADVERTDEEDIQNFMDKLLLNKQQNVQDEAAKSQFIRSPFNLSPSPNVFRPRQLNSEMHQAESDEQSETESIDAITALLQDANNEEAKEQFISGLLTGLSALNTLRNTYDRFSGK